jgi:hypothetical protein
LLAKQEARRRRTGYNASSRASLHSGRRSRPKLLEAAGRGSRLGLVWIVEKLAGLVARLVQLERLIAAALEGGRDGDLLAFLAGAFDASAPAPSILRDDCSTIPRRG